VLRLRKFWNGSGSWIWYQSLTDPDPRSGEHLYLASFNVKNMYFHTGSGGPKMWRWIRNSRCSRSRSATSLTEMDPVPTYNRWHTTRIKHEIFETPYTYGLRGYDDTEFYQHQRQWSNGNIKLNIYSKLIRYIRIQFLIKLESGILISKKWLDSILNRYRTHEQFCNFSVFCILQLQYLLPVIFFLVPEQYFIVFTVRYVPLISWVKSCRLEAKGPKYPKQCEC
jgi:hypothetical protein